MDFQTFKLKLNKTIKVSNKQNGQIGVVNIFIKSKNTNSLINDKFIQLSNLLKDTYSFDQMCNVLLDNNKEIISIINNIKTYNMVDKPSSNILFINPKYYKDINNDKTISVYENKIIDLSEKHNFILKIKKSTNYDITSKLVHYIINEDNFIKNYINSINKKSILNKKLYNDIVSGKKSDSKFLDNMTHKKNFKTTKYVLNEKNNYSIRKIRIIDFEIYEEKIVSDTRITSPNTISISLLDSSYIYINKIIVSKTLNIGNKSFKSIEEKIYFLLDIYKKIFKFDFNEINFVFNFSILFNCPNLKNDALINKIIDNNNFMNNKININNNKINLKYITHDILDDVINFLEKYENIYNKFKNINKKFTDNILYYKEDVLDLLINGELV